MPDIKLFVACHKECFLPTSKYIIPVQVGSSIAKKRFDGMLHDDDGDNISAKNAGYCELTAQYWAWKNQNADYYGFCHYRRYFNFVKEYPVDSKGEIIYRKARPYTSCNSIKSDLTAYGLEDLRIEEVVSKYDIITVLREFSNSTVADQYTHFHKTNDIEVIAEIVRELHPDYKIVTDSYINSKELYFMNMFIMKKVHFFRYMEWLFPILEEFEKRTDFSDYSMQEYRSCAYLAERLFGIWYTKEKKDCKVKCCELPYVIFEDTTPKQEVRPRWDDKSINIVFAADENFAPYLGVTLSSIVNHSRNDRKYDVVILHTKILAETQDMLSKLSFDKANISIRFCNLSDYVENITFKVHNHFSVETFYRYFILTVMSEYKKVLYLDSDMIALDDVSDLFDEDIAGYYLAAVRDMDVIGSYKSIPYTKQYIDNSLMLENPLKYFQAGVLLLNIAEMKKTISTELLVEKTLEQKWDMVDQDVLNISCHGRVKFLSQKWNVLMNWRNNGRSRMEVMQCVPRDLYTEYMEARSNPKIIHYAGLWKPWNTPGCDYFVNFWEEARKSPFYEMILYKNLSQNANGLASQLDPNMRVIRLKPTRIELRINMKKVNKILPANSVRRRVVRAMVGRFL